MTIHRASTDTRSRSRAGFTLVEMMLSLVILVMMTAMVATGIPVAQQTYEKAVVASNAQALLSTTATELRNELGLAQEVLTTGDGEEQGGTLDCFLSSEGYWARIAPAPDSAQPAGSETHAGGSAPVKNVYYGYEPPKAGDEIGFTRSLVSDKAVTTALCVTFDSITFADGVFCVNGLKVYEAGTDTVLAEVGDNGAFKVRALMAGA